MIMKLLSHPCTLAVELEGEEEEKLQKAAATSENTNILVDFLTSFGPGTGHSIMLRNALLSQPSHIKLM